MKTVYHHGFHFTNARLYDEIFIIFGPTQEGVDPILFLVKPLETASFISFLVVHHILPAINSM